VLSIAHSIVCGDICVQSVSLSFLIVFAPYTFICGSLKHILLSLLIAPNCRMAAADAGKSKTVLKTSGAVDTRVVHSYLHEESVSVHPGIVIDLDARCNI
jgi:hypothetical protein